MNNIILIGFMGTGKTTLGNLLAGHLGIPFYDSDSLIEETSGMKISEIFDRFGEEGFRRLETTTLETLSDGGPFVLATGGGIVEKHENHEILQRMGTVVWLDATPGKLWSRIKKDGTRPLATDLSAFSKLYYKRKPLYSGVASIVIDTEHINEEQTFNTVLEKINGKTSDN